MEIIGRSFSVGSTDYNVTIELNKGGFGTVYLAEPSTGNAESLVVKVPAPHVLHNPEWERRFKREARILANISHPNVVKTLGLLPYDDGALLLVQEFIDNATELFEWREASPGELVSVALQVLYGLRSTHGTAEDTRAIHRDLSPRNILVTEEGLAKIIDFGLAKEDPRTTTILTVAGRPFGTPGCMAPEQCADTATVDHRADLYALGRSLAACIQQRRPEHVEITLLDAPWRDIIGKLTEYSPNDRFASAEEAIFQILHDFHRENILPAHMEIHFEEFRSWEEAPDEWADVARDWFLWRDELNYEDLSLAQRMNKALLSNPELRVNDVFARINAGPIEGRFGASKATFSDCDPLGKMLKRWYPFLNKAQKLAAFRRLCSVAVSYHRYFVMGLVRTVYHLEGSDDIRGMLLRILEEEDPSHVIRGKGIIPR